MFSDVFGILAFGKLDAISYLKIEDAKKSFLSGIECKFSFSDESIGNKTFFVTLSSIT